MKHKTLVKDILGVMGREYKKAVKAFQAERDKGPFESLRVIANLDGQMYILEKMRDIIVDRYKDKKIPRARKARVIVRKVK